MKLLEEKTLKPTATSNEIILATRVNVLANIKDLKRFGKEINVEEVSTEEDGKNVDSYFYTVVDKDVYKVELNDVIYIGELGNFAPSIKLQTITSTSNSINIVVTTQRNEGGRLEYYIKSEDDEEYKLVQSTTEESFTFGSLIQNKKYFIKVIAVAPNNKSASITAEQMTGSVIKLTNENSKFDYSPKTWTNGAVTATASTNIEGYSIQTSLDGKKWEDSNSIILNANGPVYARLWDGINGGDKIEGYVSNIDTIAPNTFTPKANSSVNSITVTAETTDTEATETSGKSDGIQYRFSKDGGATWTEYQQSGVYKFTDMLKDVKGSTYDIVVQAMDSATNVTTSETIQATTTTNSTYFINNANTALLTTRTSATRTYYKTNNGAAMASYAFCQVQNSATGFWVFPVLVSTNASDVEYYCIDSNLGRSQSWTAAGQVEYKGVKYYYSSSAWWMPGVTNISSSLKPLNSTGNLYENKTTSDAQQKAALNLIKAYLDE